MLGVTPGPRTTFSFVDFARAAIVLDRDGEKIGVNGVADGKRGDDDGRILKGWKALERMSYMLGVTPVVFSAIATFAPLWVQSWFVGH
jgi:hypothetical protein